MFDSLEDVDEEEEDEEEDPDDNDEAEGAVPALVFKLPELLMFLLEINVLKIAKVDANLIW